MKIVFPELDKNEEAKAAAKHFPDLEFIPAKDLDEAATLLQNGLADSLVSGLDYSSRNVLLSVKQAIPLKSAFFSSCFICVKGDRTLALADGGVNKNPNQDQLYTIVEDTADTFKRFTDEKPVIAMLSYSTNGSGGKNPDLDKIHFVINKIRENHPDYLIDGEMQLDAAIDPAVSAKKFSASAVKGQANVLITPDLNSGNILYKALERFAGFTVAGPIIQGFALPLADLSRGSTEKDITLTIQVVKTLLSRDHTRLTRSGTSEAPPVTTGRSERVPKSNVLTTQKGLL